MTYTWHRMAVLESRQLVAIDGSVPMVATYNPWTGKRTDLKKDTLRWLIGVDEQQPLLDRLAPTAGATFSIDDLLKVTFDRLPADRQRILADWKTNWRTRNRLMAYDARMAYFLERLAFLEAVPGQPKRTFRRTALSLKDVVASPEDTSDFDTIRYEATDEQIVEESVAESTEPEDAQGSRELAVLLLSHLEPLVKALRRYTAS